jgi:hypothetical protein
MTGRLRRNSIHGPSGIASSAPTTRAVAVSAATSADPPCSTVMTISGNAPKPSQVPYVLTTYAVHSQRNSRPSARLVTMAAIKPARGPPAQTTARPPQHNPELYI